MRYSSENTIANGGPTHRRIRVFAAAIISGVVLFAGRSAGSEIRVFVLAGQSNMVGWLHETSVLSAGMACQADVAYRWDPFRGDLYEGPLSPVLVNRTHPRPTWGPELSFGRALADGPIAPVALVKHAVGATQISTWMPGSTNGYYAEMISSAEAMWTHLQRRGHTPRWGGFIWMQGETDAYDVYEDAAGYEQNLRDLLAHVRSDLGRGDLPVVVGRIYDSPEYLYADIVREAQQTVADDDPHATWVDTDDISRMDSYHYDGPGQIELGRRLADGWLRLTAMGGDTDLDGDVDFRDAWALLGSYRATDGMARWADGDFDGDGKVDEADATILLENWSSDVTSEHSVTGAIGMVPEPTMLALMGTGIGWVVCRGRRGRR